MSTLKQFGNFAAKYLSTKPKMRALADDETGEVYSELDELGREILDDTPMAPPVGFNPQPSLAETIRNMVRSERLAQEAGEHDLESFEEADDFDVGDDYDPSTPYENDFDPPYREIAADVAAERSKQAPPSRAKNKQPAEPASASDDQSDPVTEDGSAV